jgi:hypothetical protein
MYNFKAEHEAILKNRENPNSILTWVEYKSMTFTFQVSSTISTCSLQGEIEDSNYHIKHKHSVVLKIQVINEVLRLGNLVPGLLRRSLKDIEFKGMIPHIW